MQDLKVGYLGSLPSGGNILDFFNFLVILYNLQFLQNLKLITEKLDWIFSLQVIPCVNMSF